MSREKQILDKAETAAGRGWAKIKYNRLTGKKAFEEELERWVWRAVGKVAAGGGEQDEQAQGKETGLLRGELLLIYIWRL